MLSAQKTDSDLQRVLKPTLDKNDKLNAIIASLEEKVQSIQQVFNTAWEKFPLESQLSQTCYFTSEDGAVGSKDAQIQTLLGKFKNYQSIQQIQDDFWNLKAYCSSQCVKNGVSQPFGDSYLVSLHLMEALFTCAFMDNLSYVIQSTRVSESVSSVSAESKVNIENIAEQVLRCYEACLHDQLFADESNALINEIVPDIVELNRTIDLYNQKIKNLLEVKPNDDKSVDDSATNQIRQLLLDELAYGSLIITDDLGKLKAEQKNLIEARKYLLNQHNQQIDVFLTKMRAKVIPVQVNFATISELACITDELHQAEDAISVINEQNRLNVLESNAVVRLKEIIIANKELKGRSLQSFVDSKKPRFFGKETMKTMWEKYGNVLKDLNDSLHVQKINNFTLPTVLDVTHWTMTKDSIIEKLEAIKSRVLEIVNSQIFSLDFHKKREEIIKNEGDAMRHQASSYREISPFPKDILESRREKLDKQWEVLLADEKNIEKLKSIPKNLFAESEKQHGQKKDIYIETGSQFNRMLTAHKLQRDAEKKAQEEKKVLSDALAQGLECADANNNANQRSLEPVSLIGSIQFDMRRQSDQQSKQHGYSSFVDKPWKRALLVGVGVLIFVGLAATGVGLALEASLTLILSVALGGGAGAGLLAGGVTYACASHGDKPPEIQIQTYNAATQNTDHLRRAGIIHTMSAPSVFPVHAPNGLSGWFLHRRKDNDVNQQEQKSHKYFRR